MCASNGHFRQMQIVDVLHKVALFSASSKTESATNHKYNDVEAFEGPVTWGISDLSAEYFQFI